MMAGLLMAHPFVLISRLAVLELRSALSRKVRTRELATDNAELAHRRFHGDVRMGRFRVVALRGRHYQLADSLITTYGASSGLRTLDSLQLALALDLARHGLIQTLVTADRVLLGVAGFEDLKVLNPEA